MRAYQLFFSWKVQPGALTGSTGRRRVREVVPVLEGPLGNQLPSAAWRAGSEATAPCACSAVPLAATSVILPVPPTTSRQENRQAESFRGPAVVGYQRGSRR